jgi:hypothetical protein
VRVASVVVVAIAVALGGAGLAPAKEGARARLTAALALAAAPGATVTVHWTVDVPGSDGRREPFNAVGMFVRLLSRIGAASTIGFATPTAHTDGRYSARVSVPAGGIGGIRTGLRGSTDIFFPLENDPFTSPAGVRCDVAPVQTTLAAFDRAYNSGNLFRLDQLFSRDGFVWYSSGGPGVRRLSDARDRSTLVSYFRRRHGVRDRLSTLGFRFNGYDRTRELANFEWRGQRRADDFGGGAWFGLLGKGALDCSKAPITIAALSLGGPAR